MIKTGSQKFISSEVISKNRVVFAYENCIVMILSPK